MKKIIETDSDEGLIALLGERVLIFCVNYIYEGLLSGVNETCLLLTDANLIYETGAFNESAYKDAQHLPGSEWYVQISAIESFGRGKK